MQQTRASIELESDVSHLIPVPLFLLKFPNSVF
jgi:hypothetical protein